uniref:uncharacterized protein n=1 Tax=Pristiophorus japonicus TaxID=55135 RepID=UPI00398E9705
MRFKIYLLLKCQLFFSVFSSWNLVSGQIRYSIPEELQLGAFVGNLAADLGLDVKQLPVRSIRIVPGSRKQYVDVNLDNGILFVQDKIDRENLCGPRHTCVLTLDAVLENPLNLYQVEVEILDVNDNAPRFPKDEFRLEISEVAAPGARFPLESAHDRDIGTNSVQTYQLLPNDYFILDVQIHSGERKLPVLVLLSPLDRETDSTHRLTLIAKDGGVPVRSGTSQVTIIVKDVNDNAPVFTQSVYKVSLLETAPKGTLIITLNATDLDDGSNGEIMYSLSSHSSARARDLFDLDSKTGEIRVKGNLDYEESSVFEINIEAMDKGSGAIPQHCNVLVNMIDVNDNAPEVILRSLSSSIPEDAPLGTVVALFSAADKDSGQNGQVQCEISNTLQFKLDSSLKNYYRLLIQHRPDREHTSRYDIIIICRDSGIPPITSKKTIRVEVSDINDNAPMFTQSLYTSNVMENNVIGASIFSVTAFDPDVGQNARLNYSLVQTHIKGASVASYVSINSESGIIFAQRSFDYEQFKNFQIQVRVQDSGVPPLSSNVSVDVVILDQNDNVPVIVRPLSEYGSTATETISRLAEPGYLVAKVLATDADTGQNARLSYQIFQATHHNLFTISPDTGEIWTIRRIANKDASKQRLVIVVRDNGTPFLSTTVTIILSVVGSDTELFSNVSGLTEHPGFNPDMSLSLVIALGVISIVFLMILIILAINVHKSRNGLGGQHCCLGVCCCFETRNSLNGIQKASRNLQIPPNYVEVFGGDPLSQSFRYESCSTLQSTKRDFMPPNMCRLSIGQNYVRNESIGKEHPGMMNSVNCSNTVSNEGVIVDYTLMHIVNMKEVVFWQIINGEVTESYRDNEWNGLVLSKLGWFTLEMRFKIYLLLKCQLLFCVFSTWNPVSGQTRYSIPEELQLGAFVGNLAADLGLDVKQLPARSLRIVPGSSKQYLDVNLDNGILFVKENIDREQICGPSLTCVLTLDAVLENPLNLHQVEVEILDVNDNAPSFPKTQFRLEISELAAPGARFPLGSAHDPDIGTDSVQIYQLLPNDYFILDVQMRSGEGKLPVLVLQRSLDRETESTHSLTLIAKDGGVPVRSGTAQVTIIVKDTNDNAPVFPQSVYRVSLLETAPTGTLIITLNATDLDDGSNGEIMYSLSSHASAKVRELFDVDSKTGEITVKGKLDYEESSIFEINIQAMDKGSDAIPEHCDVLVNIIDVNDNAPDVMLRSLANSVSEDAPLGTVVALFSATDKDSAQNGQVQCQIPNTLPFKLDSSLKNYYRLLIQHLLDRENISRYDVTITCRDAGIPPITSKKTIRVEVSDINDNIPMFTQPLYTSNVMENNVIGASIFSVTAFDPDVGQNSRLKYSLLQTQVQGASVTSSVSINSENGVIFAQRSFDYEQLKNFRIQVNVQDSGVPSLASNVSVDVVILDQNDNVPVIVRPLPEYGSTATETISRHAGPGYLVAKVSATDADAGQNARLSYQIFQATHHNLFTISPDTGEIWTIRRIVSKDASKQRLVIVVRDNGIPSLSATVTIILSAVGRDTEMYSNVSGLTENTGFNPDMSLSLVIALGVISIILLVILIILAVKIHKSRNVVGGQHCSLGVCSCFETNHSLNGIQKASRSLQIPPNYVEVFGGDPLSQSFRYESCATLQSTKRDFMTPNMCNSFAGKNYVRNGSIGKVNRGMMNSENYSNTVSNEVRRF